MRQVILFDKPTTPCCFYFGWLADGREFMTRGKTVIAIAEGKEKTPEGAKTVWRDLPKEEQFDIDLSTITGSK